MSLRRFQEVLNSPSPTLYSVHFDAVFSTANGFVGRHIFKNNPRDLGLTLSIYRDCSCDIIVPLNVFSGVSDELRHTLANRYEYADQYVQLLTDKGYWNEDDWMPLGVVDLNPLLNVLIAMTNQYRALLNLVTSNAEYHFKARILQAWRKVVFLDVPQVIESFSRYGVPMLMRDEVTIPPGVDPDTFALVGTARNDDTETTHAFADGVSQAISIFLRVFSAFGVSGLLNDECPMTDGVTHSLLEAARRGAPVNGVG